MPSGFLSAGSRTISKHSSWQRYVFPGLPLLSAGRPIPNERWTGRPKPKTGRPNGRPVSMLKDALILPLLTYKMHLNISLHGRLPICWLSTLLKRNFSSLVTDNNSVKYKTLLLISLTLHAILALSLMNISLSPTKSLHCLNPVSYTHLTLPTNREV